MTARRVEIMKKRKMTVPLAAGICGDFAKQNCPRKKTLVLDVILFIPTHSLMSYDILNGTE